jgi:hypothetical protein
MKRWDIEILPGGAAFFGEGWGSCFGVGFDFESFDSVGIEHKFLFHRVPPFVFGLFVELLNCDSKKKFPWQ